MSGLNQRTLALAADGDAIAQRSLGRFYAFGPASRRDVPRAITLFKTAADRGDPRSMIELAVIYRDGVGVPKDFALATQWYRAAAEQGDAEGMFQLAQSYRYARGIPQDYAAAMHWFRAAAEKGHAGSMTYVGELYFKADGVGRDYNEAAQWFRRGADAGSAEGMLDLAYMYENGLGVPHSPEDAKLWRANHAALTRWAALPTSQEMESVYPLTAAIESVVGVAYYSCRLVEGYSLEDCHVTDEQPSGYGFGEAGFRLLPKIQLSPGLPIGSEVRVPVRFADPTGIVGSREHADACAAESLAMAKVHPLSGDAQWYARYWQALAHHFVDQAHEIDTPDRLAPQVVEASARLALGKDRGLFGLIFKCSLG